MRTVGIADLKAHLSRHLRDARGGHRLTVLDRETPVATIGPVGSDHEEFIVRKPVAGSPRPGRVKLPPPSRSRLDAASFVLEDRHRGR